MKRKHIRLSFGEEFLEYFDHLASEPEQWILSNEAYHQFLIQYNFEKKEYSHKRWKKGINIASEMLGFKLECRRNRQANNAYEIKIVGERKVETSGQMVGSLPPNAVQIDEEILKTQNEAEEFEFWPPKYRPKRVGVRDSKPYKYLKINSGRDVRHFLYYMGGGYKKYKNVCVCVCNRESFYRTTTKDNKNNERDHIWRQGL